MVVICGRNSDEMFFLTKDGNVEITCVGLSPHKVGGLYHYARQGILADSQSVSLNSNLFYVR